MCLLTCVRACVCVCGILRRGCKATRVLKRCLPVCCNNAAVGAQIDALCRGDSVPKKAIKAFLHSAVGNASNAEQELDDLISYLKACVRHIIS